MPLVYPAVVLVKSLTDELGLYLHIPFCNSKCAYCDFYSVFLNESLLDDYKNALIREIKQWGGNINRPIDTIYLGGGTPSLLSHRLPEVINAVREAFTVTEDSEITLELNPSGDIDTILRSAKSTGINRLSIGVQSGDDSELAVLGRKHTAADAVNTVTKARKIGFDNISLDIMLGLPDSDNGTLQKSLEFICNLNPEHISAYILKIEPNTAFYKRRANLDLPDDDGVSEQYLQMCDFFESKGYGHYEISNFAKETYESRHNLKYWKLHDYLGLGPGAHSCLEGKRFYYPRDLKAFIKGNEPAFDSEVDLCREYVMLALRTNEGLKFSQLENFGATAKERILKKCGPLNENGFINIHKGCITLTDKGMLLSNTIILMLTECLE